MKVGVRLLRLEIDSVRWLSNIVYETLAAKHEVVFLPEVFHCSREDRQQQLLESFVRDSDILFSIGSSRLPEILAARHRIGSNIPAIVCTLGDLPKGSFGIRERLLHHTTNDVFWVSCNADAQIAKNFLPEAKVSLLPFPFDDQHYFPLDGNDRSALRKKYGFTAADRLILYSGRALVSKNLHALLRIFKALSHIVPNVHLILAGQIQREPANELGVMPVHLRNTIDRLCEKLALPVDRLHFMGQVGGQQLRELYNIADVKVNMTLHPDENFGLSQIEAMACGTPVIGSAWGGLKDTIVDGTSGYQVSTVINSTGVKVNWWEAVNKIASLLKNPDARDSMRESCIRHANENYSPTVFRRGLMEMIDRASREAEPSPRPLKVTKFAEEFWSTCEPRSRVMYRRGHRSFELYTQHMATYCGSAPENLSPTEPLEDEHILCLACPVESDSDGGFRLADPNYPFVLHIPQPYLDTFRAVIGVMRELPVVTVGDLRERLGCPADLNSVLSWMFSGVLLRSRPVEGWVDPSVINEHLGKPLLTVHDVNSEVDFVVLSVQ